VRCLTILVFLCRADSLGEHISQDSLEYHDGAHGVALIFGETLKPIGGHLKIMSNKRLPPDQRWIDELLRWNIDHPGIIDENPPVDLEKWVLTVDGEVEEPVKLRWQEFIELSSADSKSDFHCVEGWSVRDCNWQGVKFSSITQLVKPKKDAKYVFFTCSDGYATSLDLKDLLKENVILAYKLNGKDLEESLGGPMRLVVPDKYGYKSAMWVKQITFRRTKELGYWEKRGYSDTADVWKNDRRSRW
jgi:DMSO/TMAO reductase YedYZ molybdopterin-dependent catalytic subunit